MAAPMGQEAAPHGVAAEVPGPGTCFAGRYLIEKELGRGGMGRVFVARDPKLGREVAIKVLAPGVHDEHALRRFEQEARAAGSLNHPNVLAVHDVGVAEHGPYIVSELLEGETLRKRLSRGAMVPAEAAGVAVQLARGLAASHGKGILHRDLKPENLFLLGDGRLKILDFGLAKLDRAPRAQDGPDSLNTDSGGILGTVAYMSPEQVRGRPADERSDIFAFGAILHEMLSGSRAFERESPLETGSAILNDEPPELPAGVPASLARMVGRCLAKDPAGRFQSARELLSELEAVPLEGAGIPAVQPGPFLLRRATRPWLASGVGLAVGTALALLWAGPWRQPVPLPADKRLVVLPFHDVGGGEAEQAFSGGLGEIVTTKLRQLEQFQGSLRVVSASDVLKERIASAKEARSAFGATLALAGSVHWAKDRVTVTANLVETQNQLVLAARDVDAPRESASALPGHLVERVAEMLQLELRPEARRNLVTDEEPASRAYELYVQGRGYLQRYDRVENLDSASAAFDRALEYDPSYALAHAGKAESQLRRYFHTQDPRALADARVSCRKALQLNDRLAPVHATMGMVLMSAGEYAQAIGSFERALELEPGDADTLRELANGYNAAGRTDDAEATYRRAIQLRPDSWAAHKDLGVFYYRQGRPLEALPSFQRVVALTPTNHSGYANLGGLYLTLDRHQEAIAALEKSLALKPTDHAYFNLGSSHYFQRRYREASESYRKATEMSPANERWWGGLADAYRWMPGMSDESAGAYRQAISLAEQQVAVNPRDAAVRARLGAYRIAVGDRETALKDAAEAGRLAPRDGYVSFMTAVIYEQTGRRDRALQAIEAALKSGYSRVEIEQAPPLDELRRDPRYGRLAETGVASSSASASTPK